MKALIPPSWSAEKETTGNLFRFFLRAYPRRSVAMALLLLFSGVVEGLGIAMFLPLAELATNDTESPSMAGAYVRSAFQHLQWPVTLPLLLGVICLSLIGKAVVLWIAMRQVGYAVAQVACDLRMALLRSVLLARWSHFVHRPSGHFANAIATESKQASGAFQSMSFVLAGLVQSLVYLLLAFLISWQTALLAMTAGFIALAFLHRLMDAGRQAGSLQNDLIRTMLARLVDTLHGLKPIKAMAREQHVLPLMEAENVELMNAQRRQVLATETLRCFQEPISICVLVVGFFAAITWLGEPFSVLLVQGYIFSRLVAQFHGVMNQYQSVVVRESAFWALMRQIREAEGAREPGAGGCSAPNLSHEILVDAVRFSYGETTVLHDVSLRIPAGGFVLLHGPSGGGKTTLLDIIVGFHQPKSGRILIDGINLADMNIHDWRGKIGYVPQEVFLMSDTIENNVRFGEQGLSNERIRECLEMAGAWGFVESFPGGMQEHVGERGGRLSGGQRQRLAIARALAASPSLLILDEITTALDPASEKEICETLRRLKGRVTMLAISHQSALAEVADTVYEMRGGTLLAVEPVGALRHADS